MSLVEVVVGRVGRAHGIKGEVAIEVRTDEPERRFAPGVLVRLEGAPRSYEIAAARWHGERLLVSFVGINDRTAVEQLRGAMVVIDVPADERPDDEEEFYDRQLIGLKVLDHAGNHAGDVTDVVHLPTQDLLAIETPEGERLVPFVKDLVPVVDLGAGIVRLSDVEGLLSEVED